MPARGLCAATRRAGGDVASRWYHYVNDPLGTPQRLLDDRGDVAGEVRLSAWGKAIGEGEEGRRGGGERGVTTPIRFLGQYADEETGLVYNRHQYYDPESGRFISPDPIGLEGGLNLYARGVDPTAEADVYGKYIDWVTPSPISAAEKKSMRDAARARFDADPDLKARQASLKVPRNAMQCAGVADAARRAGAGKPLQIVGLPKDDHDNEQLESWDDSIGKPRKWVDHWVNEEPDGRIVDYDQGMVFDNRQQYATAMFEKSACRLLEGDRGMVTVRAPRVPLEVVYYKATLSPSEALLRHVCSLGVDGVVIEDPVPKEGRVLWPFGDVTCSIHLFFVRARCGPWNHAIEDLVAMEAAANHGDTAFAQELAALKRAQTIVLVVEDAVPRFGRTRHFVKMLRADLIAAGRDPDAVPVVFQINRSYQEGVPTMPLSDLLPVLTWSRCDHVQAFAREKRGAKEALDRAIALYEEMKAEREAK